MDIFGEVNHWEKTEGASIFCSIINVPNPVILDYGCGAVDINGQCLEYVNQKARDEGIDCITTSIGREDYRHDFDYDTFDLIIYSDIFHGEERLYGGLHRFVMIEEAKRTLKNNGVLAVLPFHLSNFRDSNKKKSKYTHKKLIDEICSYGFTYTGKDQEGIHFEKVYSPYYQQKGGVLIINKRAASRSMVWNGVRC